MGLHRVPRPLVLLISTILLTARPTIANPQPHRSIQAGFSYNQLLARYDCAGTTCGYYDQLCCNSGSGCYTNAQDQATCTSNGASPTTAGGYWEYYTTTYVATDLLTVTSTMSTYVAGVTPAAATPTVTCNYALNETPCGSICCASDQYCYTNGQCVAAPGGGSSGYYSSYTTPGASPGPPLRGTSSALTIVTATASPTTTIPFISPVATGANVTITSDHPGGGGLSGGAIAGIVIGVLIGLFLLGLICFYCCIKGLIDTFLACIGLGRKKKTVEVEEYERRSHHASGGGGGGRTWFGTARPPPRQDKRKSEAATVLGIAGGLAALWAFLGMKRKREDRKRQEEKYSEYSYSSDYYSSQSEL